MTPKDALIFFSNTYEKRYGTKYPIVWGKDMAMMKRLMAPYSDEELKGFITHYLTKLNDKFVSENGHKLQFLSTSIPKIIAEMKAQTFPGAQTSTTNPDFERLQKARMESK